MLGVKVNGIGHNQTIILKLDTVYLLLGFAFGNPPSGSKGFHIVDKSLKRFWCVLVEYSLRGVRVQEVRVVVEKVTAAKDIFALAARIGAR